MEITFDSIKVPNLFSLAPLSDKTTTVRIGYDKNLLHQNHPEPDYLWMIVNASLLRLDIIEDEKCVIFIPHRANRFALDYSKLPHNFLSHLEAVLDYYKDSETKKKLEKRLNDVQPKNYNSTF